jgi:hypothetical protein
MCYSYSRRKKAISEEERTMFDMFKFKTKVSTKSLEAKTEAVFNVLNSHKVFGNLQDDRVAIELHSFKHMVISHATGDDKHNYLELTYPTRVRLIIHTQIFAGMADFREVTAYDHERRNTLMDYEKLNTDIQEALVEFSAW